MSDLPLIISSQLTITDFLQVLTGCLVAGIVAGYLYKMLYGKGGY